MMAAWEILSKYCYLDVGASQMHNWVNWDINDTTLHSPAWVLTAGLVQQSKVHHGLQNNLC